MGKDCNSCKRYKELTEFTASVRGRLGRIAICKRCAADRVAEWKAAQWSNNPEAERERLRRGHLKRRYGITPEQFDAILASQAGRCAVCRTDEPRHRWHVDHCHVTKKVRGILCHRCNTALGLLREDPERIKRLARYAAEHTQLRFAI